MVFQNVTPSPSTSTIISIGILYGFAAAAHIAICTLYGFAAAAHITIRILYGLPLANPLPNLKNFPNQRGKSGTKTHFAIAEIAEIAAISATVTEGNPVGCQFCYCPTISVAILCTGLPLANRLSRRQSISILLFTICQNATPKPMCAVYFRRCFRRTIWTN